MTTRDMAKKAVREQILLTALGRFKNKGFDQTTVEDIAVDIGMSVRTFFRYFRAKEDMMLAPTLGFSASFLSYFADQLESHDLWNALGYSLEKTALTCEKVGTSAQTLDLQEIILKTPILLARQLEIVERLQLEATEMAILKCSQAKELGWAMTNAIVRSAFACQRAVQCQLDGDIQSDEAVAQLRRLLDGIRPAVLG